MQLLVAFQELDAENWGSNPYGLSGTIHEAAERALAKLVWVALQGM